jgi:hypothetical protein
VIRRLLLLPLAVLLAAILTAPAGAGAWSAQGHELVGAIAEARLSPAARALVHELAGDLPLSSPEIAAWADEVKDARTRPWHYVNIPFGAGRYVAARDCPDGACAVAALQRAEAVLRDPRASAVARADALRWVVHLVGDLHQPLHAGDGRDRGGNDLRVRLRHRRQPTNLHRVWDHEVVAPIVGRRGTERAARALLADVPARTATAWAAELDPAVWAEESNREAQAIYAELGVTPGERAIVALRPWNYERAQRARAEADLTRAGVRLAAILDRIAARRGP